MRTVVQRVSRASVTVDGETVSRIGVGLVALVGVGPADGEQDARWTAAKLATLRILPDADGKMNLSISDVGGSVLVVSQFTLFGDASRGRRPSFTGAAPPDHAEPLVTLVASLLQAEHDLDAPTGAFGKHMELELVNDGPVTIVLESPLPR